MTMQDEPNMSKRWHPGFEFAPQPFKAQKPISESQNTQTKDGEMSKLIRRIMSEAQEARLDYGEIDWDEFVHDYAELILEDEQGLHSDSDVAECKEFFGIT